MTEPLIDTLTHTSGLPAHQLAGHAANFEFWVGEVKHAIDVIGGYAQRFKAIQQGEKEYAERQERNAVPINRGYRSGPPLKRGIKDQELKDLHRRLVDVMYHFVIRCFNEELITEDRLKRCVDTLGLDIREIKRQKSKNAK